MREQNHGSAQDHARSACAATPSGAAPQCAAAPAWGHNRGYDGGYDAGFADGVNDAAPGLLDAARRVLFYPSDDATYALRLAVAAAAGNAE